MICLRKYKTVKRLLPLTIDSFTGLDGVGEIT